MPDRTMMIDGVRVPRFFYGTAWKEDETARLTALALGQGFRGIDTESGRRPARGCPRDCRWRLRAHCGRAALAGVKNGRARPDSGGGAPGFG